MLAIRDSARPISSYEFQMRTNRERSRVIGALTRHTARRFVRWLRVLAQRGARLGHGLALEWRCRCDVRALQRLDDRALADIGLGRSEIECACRKRPASEIQARASGAGL